MDIQIAHRGARAQTVDLMGLWPAHPWEFGVQLGRAARGLIVPTSPLRDDPAFIEDVMQSVLDRARAAGVEFKPEVDLVIVHDGARSAIAEPDVERGEHG